MNVTQRPTSPSVIVDVRIADVLEGITVNLDLAAGKLDRVWVLRRRVLRRPMDDEIVIVDAGSIAWLNPIGSGIAIRNSQMGGYCYKASRCSFRKFCLHPMNQWS